MTEEKQQDSRGIINIHGKDYMTVAKRVELWLEDNKANNEGYSIETEIIPNNNNHVAVKAVVKYKGRTFTGISSVDLASPKMIEKQNPYEVAETSAVGRALGFAGFGIIEGIASADEVTHAIKRQSTQENHQELIQEAEQVAPTDKKDFCIIHNKQMKERFKKDGGSWFDHRWQVNGEWQQCNGQPKTEEDQGEYAGGEY